MSVTAWHTEAIEEKRWLLFSSTLKLPGFLSPEGGVVTEVVGDISAEEAGVLVWL